MRIDLTPEIQRRLQEQPYGMKVDSKRKYLRGGTCPSCQKKTLWTWYEEPGLVQCERLNNCGWDETTRNLFPDLFEKLNERYQPTQENPNATADAYLSLIRGFNIDQIKGWYTQSKYWNPNGNRGTATVKFVIDQQRGVTWERFIEDVTITKEDGEAVTRNKHNRGDFKGLWWSPPGFEINEGDEVWLVEGILDAIALALNGIKAVAILSCGTFPSESIKAHLKKNVTWVFALDNDHAGRKSLHKHVVRLRDMGENVTAAMSSISEAKQDWNDLHNARKLSPTDIDYYRYLGALELAQSYREKAMLMFSRNSARHYFLFDYRNRTYAAHVDQTKLDKAFRLFFAGVLQCDADEITEEILKSATETHADKLPAANEHAFGQSAKIIEIATFKMDFLYFQQPDNGEDGQYFIRLRFANGSPEQQIPFTGKTLAAAGDFKKAAMHKAPGAQFTGSNNDMDELYRRWMSNPARVVRTLDFIGYDRESGAYVYNEFAVDGGRILELNSESFFQLRRQGVKTTVDIRQRLVTKFQADWFSDYVTAYGVKGLIALAWWLGCLYVEQIRAQYRSYPFFAVIGDPGSGKSAMVDFLWKLYGREGDSFNPNDSTLAGRTRKMSEVANLPVVFNETDNEQQAEERHLRKFNWNTLKDLYDGEFGRVTGVKTQDNQTKQPRFKGGLMALQNPEIDASEAIQTRFCRMWFDCSHHSPAGKIAADRLNARSIESCSGFLIHATRQAETILTRFNERFRSHLKQIQAHEKIKLQRIAENHAKLAALVDCLEHLLPDVPNNLIEQAHFEITHMAIERQQALNEDHPIVQQFWAAFDYLDSKPVNDQGYIVAKENLLNHASEPKAMIAVNLEDFHSRCRRHGLEPIETNELRRWLKTSRKRKFLRNEPVHSYWEKRPVRCWVFERPRGV